MYVVIHVQSDIGIIEDGETAYEAILTSKDLPLLEYFPINSIEQINYRFNNLDCESVRADFDGDNRHVIIRYIVDKTPAIASIQMQQDKLDTLSVRMFHSESDLYSYLEHAEAYVKSNQPTYTKKYGPIEYADQGHKIWFIDHIQAEDHCMV